MEAGKIGVIQKKLANIGLTSPRILSYSSVSTNIWSYIHRRYIAQFLRQLTEEYNLYSSVTNVSVFPVVYDGKVCSSC
jgi:hypothetical protein